MNYPTPEDRVWWQGRRKTSSSWHLAKVSNDVVVSECPPHYEMPTTGTMRKGAEPPGKICGNCASYLHRPVRASKMCARCRTVKTFEDFYKIRKSPDGLAAWCSECTLAARRASSNGKGPTGGKKQRKKIPDGSGTVCKSFRVDPEVHGLLVMAADHFGVTQSYLMGAILTKALREFARNPERYELS